MDEVSDISAEPLVSVVIPAYNAGKTLQRAMASVLQERSVPLELIVVDDGSTDSTPKLIDAVAQTDKRARRITRPNGHVAAAYNTGIRASCGKYVAFLEADDEWLPGKLRQQIDILESWPEVGAVFSNFYNHDEVTNVRQLLSEQQKQVLEALPKKRIGNHDVIIDGDMRPFLIRSNFILCSSITMRRQLLLKLDGCDENLKGGQDWDLWVRMGAEIQFGYNENPLVVRYKGRDSMSRPTPKWFRALIKAQEKVLSIAQQVPELRPEVSLLKYQLRLAHRSLIVSHVKHWQWWHACKALVAGLEFGFDPLSFLLVGLGVLGPIPFTLRRIVLGRLKSSNSVITTE